MRELRARARERLKELRALIADIKRRRREKVAGVRAMCRAERARLKAERDALRSGCPLSAAVAARASDEELAAAAREVVEVRARLRDGSRGGRKRGRVELLPPVKKRGESKTRAATVARSWIKRREADEFIESDLPRELVPAWRKVRHRMKATPRTSRREVFLDWAHNHPQVVAEASSQALERELWAAMEEEKSLRRAMSGGRKSRRGVAAAYDLSDVPF